MSLIVSTAPLTSEMFTFLDMRGMLVSEAVSVPTFILGGLRGSNATSDLVKFFIEVCNLTCPFDHIQTSEVFKTPYIPRGL